MLVHSNCNRIAPNNQLRRITRELISRIPNGDLRIQMPSLMHELNISLSISRIFVCAAVRVCVLFIPCRFVFRQSGREMRKVESKDILEYYDYNITRSVLYLFRITRCNHFSRETADAVATVCSNIKIKPKNDRNATSHSSCVYCTCRTNKSSSFLHRVPSRKHTVMPTSLHHQRKENRKH